MVDLSKFKEYARSFFLQRAAGYCLIILSGLFVIGPLADLQIQLDDQCLLYAEVQYEYLNASTDLHSFLLRPLFGPASVCEYNLAVSALFSLIYPLAMVGAYCFCYLREKKNVETDLGRVWFLVHGLIEVAIVVLMLVSAGTISHGFTSLCASISDARPGAYYIESCSEAQNANWLDYDVSNFYVCLSIATAGSWFQFVIWLLQAIFVLWKLWRLNMLPVLPDWMKPGSSG